VITKHILNRVTICQITNFDVGVSHKWAKLIEKKGVSTSIPFSFPNLLFTVIINMYIYISSIVLSNVFTPTRKARDFKACIAVTWNTQIHEGRRGYQHGGSREYTLDGANTFTLMKHKLLRHTHG